MKKISYLVAAATAAITSTSAFAGITLTETSISVGTTLANAGWTGYQLDLVADSSSGTVQSWNFSGTTAVATNASLVGIQGPIQQKWIIDNVTWYNNGATGPIPRDPTPQVTGTSGNTNGIPTTLNGRTDSFWIIPFSQSGTSGGTAIFQTFEVGEDNNLQNNPPFTGYTGSPSTDNPGDNGVNDSNPSNGSDFGVGSLMTFQGGILGSSALLQDQPIAFIIIPNSSSGVQVTVYGTANDPNTGAAENGNNGYLINYTFNTAAAVPEPASLGVLGLGGLALLIRRRRNKT